MMDWKIRPGELPKIKTNRLVGRLPAASGPCPECGRPAVWTTSGGEPVVQHHDPIEHEACPLTIERNRARRMLVEAVEKLDLDYLALTEPGAHVEQTLSRLAAEQRTLIDAKLMTLPPDYRLCMHGGLETLSELDAAFSGADTVTFRVRQRGHVLEPGEACRYHGTRTEYGWPAGTIAERPRPCGRLDDCRVIEAADGTRYWFRCHGCPAKELPPPRWTDLDEQAADAWRTECEFRKLRKSYDPEAFADVLDACIRDAMAAITAAEPAESDDDEPLYNKIVRLFDMIESSPEERFQPYMWPRRWLYRWPAKPPEEDPARYLGGLDKP